MKPESDIVPACSPKIANADLSLLEIADFLRGMCHTLLARFPDVQRWDQTDDIFQSAALRLHRALQETTPESRRHLENLAAVQVRRTLIDLGRKYAASLTMNQNRWTPLNTSQPFDLISNTFASDESDPQALTDWVELHETIDQLPDDEREVFQLIWYRGISKGEVAEMLHIDLRTVQRRWRAARATLARRSSDQS